MNNRSYKRTWLLLAAAAVCGRLSATIIYSPDPTTGTYTTIPAFEFNSPIGSIAPGAYTGTGGIFLAPPFSGAASGAVVAGGAVGNGGQVTINTGFNGPGTGLIWNSVLNVSAGQSYVISAFAKVSPGTTSNVYIDLWDVPGDRNVQFDKTYSAGWQFAYETFTAPANMVVGARAILDFSASKGDSVIFDNFAITPLSSFVPPSVQVVPEPQTYVLVILGAGMIGLNALRRHRS